MLKKILIAVMVLVVALAVVACGGEDAPETPVGDDTPAADAGNDDVTDAPAGADHVHAYEEKVEVGTCTTAGKVTMICECGDIQSEIDTGFANHTESVRDCEKDTVCTVCGTVLEEKTGHFVAAYNAETAATCATAGKEKGTCENCGKVIEREVPATGHVLSGAITISGGSFTTSCSGCGQSVTLTAQTPAFQLAFEGDVAAEAANDIGLEVYQPESWKTADFNGSKAFAVDPGKPFYINIKDPAKLAALGTFVISFDYTSTTEAAANTAGSIFSLLNNHYDAKQTSVGATGWGWMIKYIENADKIAVIDNADNLSASNSIDAPHGTTFKVQIVVSSAEKATHTFINGTYIGTSDRAFAIATLAPANACFRFGDGPALGHVIDNFTISALK